MQKPILVIFLLALTVLCCKKQDEKQVDPNCEHSTQLPLINYSNPFVVIDYQKNHCGYFPLSRNNYWVYLDSIYDNNGEFLKTAIDTLRFIRTYQNFDGIIWWEPNIFPGILRYMYSTDSIFYTLGDNWGGKPAIKWFYPISDDSTIEAPSYSDYTTIAKTYKINTNITVPAGSFSNCLLYRKELFFPSTLDVTFKPGIGILKFRQYMYDNARVIRISTLLSYHLE